MAASNPQDALAHFKEILEWDWQADTSADGISIMKHDYPDSSIAAFYGEQVVDGNARKFGDILWNGDLAMYKRWDSKCLDWRVVEQLNDDSRVEYTLQELPWPVWNRDFGMVLKLSLLLFDLFNRLFFFFFFFQLDSLTCVFLIRFLTLIHILTHLPIHL
mmetsp:Transcript_17807/g.45316  ORF Transcript_17807/g.45316 Transcript_17807/m.45316 type:complete len:160 (+) Transcript_17807:74-553(+)